MALLMMAAHISLKIHCMNGMQSIPVLYKLVNYQ